MQVVFKNYTPSNNYICETNNTQVGNAKDLDAVMRMYNLIKH